MVIVVLLAIVFHIPCYVIAGMTALMDLMKKIVQINLVITALRSVPCEVLIEWNVNVLKDTQRLTTLPTLAELMVCNVV